MRSPQVIKPGGAYAGGGVQQQRLHREKKQKKKKEISRTYRISNLKHRSGGSGFITAHDILDHDVASLFLRPEYGPPHYRGELVFWEVLSGREIEVRKDISRAKVIERKSKYLCSISNLEETSSSVED